MYESLAALRVLVVGDVMLDEYWFGDVRRISPEAPVPVVHVSRSEERPGGAANVARNMVALGAQATLLSIVGQDETAGRLRKVLDECRIRHVLAEDESIRTTLKLRVIGHQQQMLRIDFERPPSAAALDVKLSEFDRLLQDSDIVVFSDYGKGALDLIGNCMDLAKRRGVMTFVDPKGRDYGRYAGADVITPNRSELAEMMGPWRSDDEMDAKARQLRSELGIDALLLTLSEHGMKLYGDGITLLRPARAKEIYDVSGAGDTVIAAIAALRGIGASWEEAIEFANVAAGIVVSRLGTAAATFDEVAAELHASAEPAS